MIYPAGTQLTRNDGVRFVADGRTDYGKSYSASGGGSTPSTYSPPASQSVQTPTKASDSVISGLQSQLRAGNITGQDAYRAALAAANIHESDPAANTVKSQLFGNLGTVNSGGRVGYFDMTSLNFIPTATTTKHTTVTPSGFSNTTTNTEKYIQMPNGTQVNYQYASPQVRAAADSGQYQIINKEVAGGSTGGSSGVSGDFGGLINSDPFLSGLFTDPNQTAMFEALPDELKSVFLQTASTLGKAVAAGKVVNPDIEITPAQNQAFIDQAMKELDPYYQEKLGSLRNDFTTSISRLMEDYNKTGTRADETVKETLGTQAQNEAEAGTAFSSGRVERRGRTLTLANQSLEDLATSASRSAQDAANKYEQSAGSNALRSLNIPGLTPYTATTSGVAASGSRSLYSPLGNISIGEIPGQQKVAVATRRSQLETAFRTGRNLDLNALS